MSSYNNLFAIWIKNSKELLNRNGSRRVIENIVWLFSDLIIRMAVSLVVGVWVARYLGPEQYGLLSFSLAFIAIFTGLVPLGLQGLVVRDLAKSLTDSNLILGTALVVILCSSVFSYLLLATIILFIRHDNDIVQYLVLIGGLSLFFKVTDVIKYWFESQVKSKHVVLVQNGALLLTSFIKIFLIFSQAPIYMFIWMVVIESIFGFFGLLYIYKRKEGGHFAVWVFDFEKAISYLKQGWPLLLSSLSVIANLNIDKIMLGQLTNSHELGLYSVASNLAQVWYAIPVLIGASLAPSLTKIFHQNYDMYLYRINRIFFYLFWMSLAIGILVSIFGERIIVFVYGQQYKSSASILVIQIFTAIFLFHISFRKRLLLIEGYEKNILYLSLCMLLVNVVANIYLIPLLHGIGAAYSSLLSWVSNALLFPLFFKQTRQHPKLFFSAIFLRGQRANKKSTFYN